jgi:hypothetical protein
MPKRIVAVAGLMLITVILVLFDLSVSNFSDPNSWAKIAKSGLRTQPGVAWVVGVVIGHLYHPFGNAPIREHLAAPWNVLVDPLGKWPIARIVLALGASTLVIVLIGLILKELNVYPSPWPFGLAGMVFGAFMWPTSFTND